MSETLRQTIYQALADVRLIDPHTHIQPHAPASSTLADLLGYHYYTELAHSAGLSREVIEEPGLSPREKVGRLVAGLEPLENTAQYSWLIEICRRFFDFDGDRLDTSNWEQVYDAAEAKMQIADWPDMVLEKSGVEAVFLTNDFDDPLEGFDTQKYIPCLRTDDLVFHLGRHEVRERLAVCSNIDLTNLADLRAALESRFEHFVSRGARACAISLPPRFTPSAVPDGRAATALEAILREGTAAAAAHHDALARRVFWTLAELCDAYGLPFDLMIGVNRGVYPGGVYQGQDLYDSRVSLIQYRDLFNSFPDVRFPVSVLASVTNQELVSYAWIFPNVITNGHWWYSNTPSFIERDAAARLEAVPQTKQIGYYSDAYKLEFVWPKFDMYRKILAKILAESFVIDRGWSETRAIELGARILRDNVERCFPPLRTPAAAARDTPPASHLEPESLAPESPSPESPAIGLPAGSAVVAPAAGEIAGVFVEETADAAPVPAQEAPVPAQEAPVPAEEIPGEEIPGEEIVATPAAEVAFDHHQEHLDEQDDHELWHAAEANAAHEAEPDPSLDPESPADPEVLPDPESLTPSDPDDESEPPLVTVVEDAEEDPSADVSGETLVEAERTLPETEPEPATNESTSWPEAEDETLREMKTVELEDTPTVHEAPHPTDPPPIAFDDQQEVADEQDDAELWGAATSEPAPAEPLRADAAVPQESPLDSPSFEPTAAPETDTAEIAPAASAEPTLPAEPTAAAPMEPTAAEPASNPVATPASEEAEENVVFDADQEAADEEDDALLWADEDEPPGIDRDPDKQDSDDDPTQRRP